MEQSERSSEISMQELAALVETAGGQAVGMMIQNRPTPDPRSFIGDGKVAELKEFIEMNNCDLAVFDNELSPSQMRVLGEELGVKVLDRSGLILDIFAQRAQTREGQLQVELAQYKYLLPRLTGMWTHLVRQTASGGSSPIGTRGPGETQLETDRRHIRRKIQKLEEELAAVRKVRSTQRRKREKNDVPVVALVGYTNAGKSTLLNCLTDAGIPANDRLFDTLDTTTRKLRIDEVTEVLISDTGRLYPQASAPSGRGVQGNARGAELRRCSAACHRHLKPRLGGAGRASLTSLSASLEPSRRRASAFSTSAMPTSAYCRTVRTSSAFRQKAARAYRSWCSACRLCSTAATTRSRCAYRIPTPGSWIF